MSADNFDAAMAEAKAEERAARREARCRARFDGLSGAWCSFRLLDYSGADLTRAEAARSGPVDWQEYTGGFYVGGFFYHNYLTCGDYCDSTVEQSNVRVWAREFPEGRGVWWHERGSGYGSRIIVIDAFANVPAEAIEVLSALESYPAIDDEDVSRLESELEAKAWERTFAADYWAALVAYGMASEEAEEPTPGTLWRLFHEVADRCGEYWAHHGGDSSWIDVERVAKATRADELAEALAEVAA